MATMLGLRFAVAPVTIDRIRVDDADLATVGAAVTVNGVAVLDPVAGIDLVANLTRLSGDITEEENDFIEFSFAGGQDNNSRNGW